MRGQDQVDHDIAGERNLLKFGIAELSQVRSYRACQRAFPPVDPNVDVSLFLLLHSFHPIGDDSRLGGLAIGRRVTVRMDSHGASKLAATPMCAPQPTRSIRPELLFWT